MTKTTAKYIVVSGATATGKTQISIQIAKHIKENLNRKVEIINFDSLLFYKELNIGTAKPTTEEMCGINHHLVGSHSISEELNASNFVSAAKNIFTNLINQETIPILVGGSAFYIRALIKGMIESNSGQEKKASLDGNSKEIISDKNKLILFLKENDPDIFNLIHINDHYRLGRAAEYFILNNEKYSIKMKQIEMNSPYDFSINNQLEGEMLHIYLQMEKEKHLEIILNRTRKMIQDGLIDEVSKIIQSGYNLNLKPLKSIGYKETIEYLNRSEQNKDYLIENIFISTRQLAKSQKTFFKKITPKITLNPLSIDDNFYANIDNFVNK